MTLNQMPRFTGFQTSLFPMFVFETLAVAALVGFLGLMGFMTLAKPGRHESTQQRMQRLGRF
jgi:hypothetical protein